MSLVRHTNVTSQHTATTMRTMLRCLAGISSDPLYAVEGDLGGATIVESPVNVFTITFANGNALRIHAGVTSAEHAFRVFQQEGDGTFQTVAVLDTMVESAGQNMNSPQTNMMIVFENSFMLRGWNVGGNSEHAYLVLSPEEHPRLRGAADRLFIARIVNGGFSYMPRLDYYTDPNGAVVARSDMLRLTSLTDVGSDLYYDPSDSQLKMTIVPHYIAMRGGVFLPTEANIYRVGLTNVLNTRYDAPVGQLVVFSLFGWAMRYTS